MKAIAAPGYGPRDSLVQIDMPVPSPGAGEVRVRVVASALNPADFKVVTGSLKRFHARNRPLVVGYDDSGTPNRLNAVEVQRSPRQRPRGVGPRIRLRGR